MYVSDSLFITIHEYLFYCKFLLDLFNNCVSRQVGVKNRDWVNDWMLIPGATHAIKLPCPPIFMQSRNI